MGADRDFEIEKLRYNKRAIEILESEISALNHVVDWGSQELLFSESQNALNSCFNHNDELLELGAGTGDHTGKLLKVTNKSVRALDISEFSLKVLTTRYPDRVIPILASMDRIPLANSSIDGLASFGSLAYADPIATDSEILRVIRKGGSAVIVDTLNNWSIYRVKRFLNYLLGRRSKAVFKRIPKMQRIENLAENFQSYELEYYGFLYPLEKPLKLIFGKKIALKIIDKYDRKLSNRFNCLKFMLVLKHKI